MLGRTYAAAPSACLTTPVVNFAYEAALLAFLPAQKVLLHIMLVLVVTSFLLCFSAMAYLLVLGESFTDALQVRPHWGCHYANATQQARAARQSHVHGAMLYKLWLMQR